MNEVLKQQTKCDQKCILVILAITMDDTVTSRISKLKQISNKIWNSVKLNILSKSISNVTYYATGRLTSLVTYLKLKHNWPSWKPCDPGLLSQGNGLSKASCRSILLTSHLSAFKPYFHDTQLKREKTEVRNPPCMACVEELPGTKLPKVTWDRAENAIWVHRSLLLTALHLILRSHPWPWLLCPRIAKKWEQWIRHYKVENWTSFCDFRQQS